MHVAQRIPRRKRCTRDGRLDSAHYPHFLASPCTPVDQVHREHPIGNGGHSGIKTAYSAIAAWASHLITEAALAAGGKAVGAANNWRVASPVCVGAAVEIIRPLSLGLGELHGQGHTGQRQEKSSFHKGMWLSAGGAFLLVL